MNTKFHQAWMRYLKRKTNFYIGGFASAKCSATLTGDRGIYAKYFPALVWYEHCLKASIAGHP